MRKNSLKSKIKTRIKRGRGSVYMIGDFLDILPSREQIQRALRQLMDDGVVVRVGKGVYVRAMRSRFSGNIIPEEDIRAIATEVVERGGGEVRYTPEQRAYNERRSTQVPNMFFIGTNKRISRKIKFKEAEIKYVMVK